MSNNTGNSQNNRQTFGLTNLDGGIPDGNMGGYRIFGSDAYNGDVYDGDVYDGVSEPFQDQPMANSSGQFTWLDHLNDVSTIPGLREPDFGNSMAPMGGGVWPSAEQVHNFNSQAAPYSLFDGGLPHLSSPLQPPAATIMGSYTNPAPLLGPSAQTDFMTASLSPETPISPTPIHDRSTRDITDEVNMMLLTLRDAGQGYSEISAAIQRRFGVMISCNALTKRYNKMEGVRMSLLATAIQSSMPEIMSLIESRLTQMDNGSLSETERQRVRELMVDLPNSFPRWVENRLTRRGGSTPSRVPTLGFP
ncbi:hypothetical protein B0T24DRAFT_198419 [Lasiosphaeria ovina]|uniref:Uncharacterized protein n=1 Tax=Lasiosphaeria ovina TaxID=92902 RepID=A0AAE0NFN2_9PEZI|nr:hypothetical protein B0T24DRAFT_198419 [Lasiosphaeria ovina]